MATFDLTTGYAGQLSDPVSMMVGPITPSDVADLPFVPTAIFVSGAGTVTFTPFKTVAAPTPGQTVGVVASADVVLTLPVGWHPIRCTRIKATGTSATGIGIGTV